MEFTVWLLTYSGEVRTLAVGVDAARADAIARDHRDAGHAYDHVAVLPAFIAADDFTPNTFRSVACGPRR